MVEDTEVNVGRKGPWSHADPYLPNFRGRLPTESFGFCRKCHKEALLGSGLCVKCWDNTWQRNFVEARRRANSN